jgi:hypothetical protein
MAKAVTPFEIRRDDRDLLEWKDKRRFQRIFTRDAVRSYLVLSFGMGLLALSLPFLLVAIGGYDGHYSISYFYYVNELARNVLVGILWAIGVFLILFHGLSSLENWLLNVAGLAAISIAINPMDPISNNGSGEGSGITIHSASAILFFALLAVVAVFLSKGRIRYIRSPVARRTFAGLYDAAALLMVAMPVAVVLIHFVGRGAVQTHWVFWIECLGIAGFAMYWFVKTVEYKLLLRIRLGG